MHLATHLFDDIEVKGVTQNYMTKTFEVMHGPLRVTYFQVTNFKAIEGQVCKYYLTTHASMTNQ
jgi:hypothetical protein